MGKGSMDDSAAQRIAKARGQKVSNNDRSRLPCHVTCTDSETHRIIPHHTALIISPPAFTLTHPPATITSTTAAAAAITTTRKKTSPPSLLSFFGASDHPRTRSDYRWTNKHPGRLHQAGQDGGAEQQGPERKRQVGRALVALPEGFLRVR